MDFFFGLFTGYFLNFTALWILFFIGILFEAFDHHKLAIFVGMIVAAIVYFKQLITGEYLLYGAIVYFVVGIVWSVWRYRRFIDAKTGA